MTKEEIERISIKLDEINEKEPEMCAAISMLINHVHGTYSDKYDKGKDFIDTKKMLYSKSCGEYINVYQVSRYLQRYMTIGCKKSRLIVDIMKAIHYLLFELVRRIKMQDTEQVEPAI